MHSSVIPKSNLAAIGNLFEQTADAAARQYGLSAMDALHVAAAYLLGADELVTTERPSKPIYRNGLVKVVYLYAGL
jgi:predicted nucleic acid-binding protein